ncbi:uncharacterized protein L969DRAFT_40612, partial [Mixia osmundae IAM 14324]|uniref:uncharacterized protein n=1 Tax=Mixia osmundae (strain CBS 9802 / IAM 14324 / JCM 22182 / KY 12970) TaxID=764103 RepID=UPI0004A553CE
DRGAQQTGANHAPLAGPRRWGGAASSEYSPSAPSGPQSYGGSGGGGSGGGSQYGRSSGPQGPYGNNQTQATPGGYVPHPYNQTQSRFSGIPGAAQLGSYGSPQREEESSSAPLAPGERRRKSRWGDEKDKIQVAGLPTAITGQVAQQDLTNYATQLRLEEIQRKLKLNDVVPPERLRSPSPPPTYDHMGRRTNTREVRYRRKLEDERNSLVERAMRTDPTFRPPPEYMMAKRTGRPQERVYIPVKEFPEINFFGLLVGPRGNTLKGMERESGAKISIRGKGSVKEGKGRPEAFAGDENEELHCLIQADSEEKVQKCVKLVNKVIETAASTPEAQNDHKRNQLRELAQLNGTLRDDEGQPCLNCGQIGHRKYDCPEQINFTANVICHKCGGAGHMARDCMQGRAPNPNMIAPGMPGMPQMMSAPMGAGPMQGAFDSEYASLMAELGETPRTEEQANAAEANGMSTSSVPPWRIPSNWHPPMPPSGAASAGLSVYRPPPPAGGYGAYPAAQTAHGYA